MNKPQNIYDDPVFFAKYKDLRRNDTGLNGDLEIPALRGLLPDLNGASVLDLGCGFGDFSRYAREKGAQDVTGVEISGKMLEEANRLTNDDRINYINAAIEDFKFENDRYHLVASSLALHYINDFNRICRNVFSCLKKGGYFVFSVEHPMCTAWPVGWLGSDENLFWPVRDYHDESVRHTKWFVDDVVKYHRTTQTYISDLIGCGFNICALKEPQPLPDAVKKRPELAVHNMRPPFLIISARK
ncbi:class I SAM-dependent methyltransferase [Brenneria izadpanahii]|uniref:Class I SAM-dependent methyltransferase n=1 Tax=Brenneria izadpanahii TaxID=2722756 RepID=A0ABX7UN13_9GAMM|nr:class I SAM-dependent methyltransferase [Brenneria izadpanahii]QTF06600.1 class I SAM-dependent methyltransferase [Brenneria izadpanahii]